MITVLHLDTGRTFRGGQRQIHIMIKNLAQYEIEQYIACPEDSPLVDKTKDFVKENIIIAKNNLTRLFETGKLTKFIIENKINIVHAHDSHSHGLAALLKSKDKHPQIVVTRRSSGRIGFGSKSKYLDHNIQYIAISEHIRDMLINGGVGEKKVTVIPSMIDYNLFQKTIETYKNPVVRDKKKKLISAGVFEAKKGYMDVVKAVHKLSRLRQDFIYAAFGDGPERKKISAYIERNGLKEYIELPGWIDNPLDYLKEADIFIAPSYQEGLNSSLIEAMAAGVPVIASAIPAHRQNIIDGISGLTFPPGDIDYILRQLEFILNHPEKAGVMAQKSKKIALQYDCMTLSLRIYDLYLQTVAPH